MPKLATLLGYENKTYTKGEVGLEIETETARAYRCIEDINTHWTVHQDGSLRHYGIEYVFRQPLDVRSKAYDEALAAFKKQAETVKFLKSVYSSVHVHMNMLDKQVLHMFNFITLYMLFEEVLAEYCGNDRNGNLFCLKVSNAEYIYTAITNMAKAVDEGQGKRNIMGLNANLLKYSGLNIAPLRQFGSLEIRLHGGTTSIVEVDRWVQILYKLYQKADTFDNPVEIVNRLNGFRSKQAFAEVIFEEYARYLPLTDLNNKMEDGVWYATGLGESVKDWKTLGKKELKAKPDKASLKKYYGYIDDAPPRVEEHEAMAVAFEQLQRLREIQPATRIRRGATITTTNASAAVNFNIEDL